MNMKTSEGDLLFNNYTSEALGFFLNYRTPAAIIATASLQCLLHLTRIHHKQDRKNKEKNRLERLLVILCHIHFLLSFILSIIVLVISTTAEISVYKSESKPLAENTFELLNTEFHFEFAAVRWCFFGCALCLLKGCGCHLLLEYNLLKKEKRTEGSIIFFTFLSILSGLLSFMNSSELTEPWINWLYMSFDLAKMTWFDSIGFSKPLLAVSLLSMGGCLGMLILLCLGNVKNTIGITKAMDKSHGHKGASTEGKARDEGTEEKAEIEADSKKGQ